MTVSRIFPGNQPRPEQLARLAPWITLALVIVLAFQAARITWTLMPLPTVDAPAISRIASPSRGQTQDSDYQSIADWHLFGEITTTPIAAPPPVTEAPETKLDLKLVGILHSDEDRQARAIIGQRGEPELVYKVGDSIGTGVSLASIEQNRVILSRGGKLEALSLPADTDPSARALNALPSSLPGAVSAEDESAVNASEVAARIRQQLEEDPGSALAEIALANPYVQDGRFIGFRLRPGRDRRLLGRLGLRSGDVITEVNGNRLSSPAEGLALLQGLLNADQIAVKVLRNGEEIPFTFYLNQ